MAVVWRQVMTNEGLGNSTFDVKERERLARVSIAFHPVTIGQMTWWGIVVYFYCALMAWWGVRGLSSTRVFLW
jgi:hypothetical protein